MSSFPPAQPAFRQLSASAPLRTKTAFARADLRPHVGCTSGGRVNPSRLRQDCYPSPFSWPGSLWTGQFFARRPNSPRRAARPLPPLHRQASALPAPGYGFSYFRCALDGVRLRAIINPTRGSTTCANSSFLPFFPPRFRPVWPMIPNALWPAPLPVPPLPRPRTAMSSPGLLPAVPQARFATISPRSAAKAARAATTSGPSRSAALTGHQHDFTAIRGKRPRVAVLLCNTRPGPGAPMGET